MARFPACLHVLLARQAPVGVVIRRGPSKAVCTIAWDRKRDQFQIGQWLRGRIYERRADLSTVASPGKQIPRNGFGGQGNIGVKSALGGLHHEYFLVDACA